MGIVEVAGMGFLLLLALVCMRVIMQKIDEGRLDAGCFALFVIFVLLPIGLVSLVSVLVFLVTGNEEGTIIGILLGLVVDAVLIYIVGRLNVGMTIDGIVPAIIVAAPIAILSSLLTHVLGYSVLTNAISILVIVPVVLLISDRFVKGLKVNGFVGAIIASIAIGVVTWIIGWLLGLLALA